MQLQSYLLRVVKVWTVESTGQGEAYSRCNDSPKTETLFCLVRAPLGQTPVNCSPPIVSEEYVFVRLSIYTAARGQTDM